MRRQVSFRCCWQLASTNKRSSLVSHPLRTPHRPPFAHIFVRTTLSPKQHDGYINWKPWRFVANITRNRCLFYFFFLLLNNSKKKKQYHFKKSKYSINLLQFKKIKTIFAYLLYEIKSVGKIFLHLIDQLFFFIILLQEGVIMKVQPL